MSELILTLVSHLISEKSLTEIRLRIRTWWLIAASLLGALIFNRVVSLLFFAFVSFLALKEYLSMIPTRRADRRVIFWGYFAISVQYFWIYVDWYTMFLIFIPVYAFLFLPLRMVLIGETKDFLKAVSTLHWGLMMTVFALSHMAFLLNLDPGRNPAGQGAGLVLYLVLLTELNDIAQFIWGKLFGKHKVIPKVSPNKTVEGLLGGIVTTMLLSWLMAPYLTPLQPHTAVLFGLAISLCGFFGDVSISAIKRDIGVKDSGNTLPGHGGVLDRLDSLTYTAPVFFHLLKYFYY